MNTRKEAWGHDLINWWTN